MTTTASEYKKAVKRSKDVKLPSGAEFHIKALGALDFWNIKGAEPIMQGQKVDPKNNAEFMKALIVKCVVNPQIVLENAKDGQLLLDDLTLDDVTVLSNEIMELSVKKENTDFLAGKGKQPS